MGRGRASAGRCGSALAARASAPIFLTSTSTSESRVTTVSSPEVYYDPFDFDIDTDPYPVWKRLRDEAPLYYNDKHDFYAVSRYADVEPVLADWRTYPSGKGSVLEVIK